jgi:phage terminase Nu1 subunit (DNA packaging protein)
VASNDGRALVSADLAEIQHMPLPVRSRGGHQVDSFTLKACIDSLQRELAKVEALAGRHQADFERERERAPSTG